MKRIYNISSPAVTSVTNIRSETGCNSQTYYIPPESIFLYTKMSRLGVTIFFILNMMNIPTGKTLDW
jgi:hypothetical protein